MLISVVLLICGFAILLLGADWLVKGASSLAKKFNVPEIVIGLTVVAFGTSTPELCVNIISNLNGATELCFGDPIGSNIFNILIVLGLTVLICPIGVKKATIWKEIPFSLLAALIVMLLANDAWFRTSAVNRLGRLDSLIMLLIFGIFLLYTRHLTKKGDVEVSDVKVYSLFITIGAIITGLGGLVLGGKIVVTQAVAIANMLKIDQKIIGLTIVAAGTSLPELATSITAALKKHPDIAIGNVVGSNIFNILLILGASSMMAPLPYKTSFNFDFYMVFFVTIILFAYMFIHTKYRLNRWQGGLFVLIYIGYVASMVR
jgi:cation:H+ antiporter